MRVLHFTNAYPSDDRPVFGIFVREQIESLAEAGVENEVLFLDGRMGWKAYLETAAKLRRMAGDFDLIHCHHMICGFVAVLSGLGHKALVSFMSDGSRNYKGRIPGLGRLMFMLTARMSRGNIFKSRIPPGLAGKSILLPNGVDETRFVIRDRQQACERLGLDSSRRYLLFVSANDPGRPEKRIDIFRRVLAMARDRVDSRFEELVLSNVARDEVPWFYAAAETHVLTSDVEGSPNSVKEALAAGTPVVARDVGSVRQLLDGVHGCTCVTGTRVSDYVDGLVRAAEASPELVRGDFRAKGLSRSAVAERLSGFYRQMAMGL